MPLYNRAPQTVLGEGTGRGADEECVGDTLGEVFPAFLGRVGGEEGLDESLQRDWLETVGISIQGALRSAPSKHAAKHLKKPPPQFGPPLRVRQ
ncbi:MAG: hypothetical protein Q8L48_05195 [Archangium sp.]|nr:hypothetical protein [Archangium sp.]